MAAFSTAFQRPLRNLRCPPRIPGPIPRANYALRDRPRPEAAIHLKRITAPFSLMLILLVLPASGASSLVAYELAAISHTNVLENLTALPPGGVIKPEVYRAYDAATRPVGAAHLECNHAILSEGRVA